MKTTIMGLAAFALLFTSCSKNEVADAPFKNSDDRLIGFNSYTGSRAVDNTIDELQQGFTVIAMKTPVNGDAELFTSKYLFKTGKWGWETPGSEHAWPIANSDDYPLTFASFFPTNVAFTFAARDVAIEIAGAAKDQVDYLYANTVATAQPTSGVAPMAFKHILSKVLFSVKSTTTHKVNVQSIRIVNVQDQSSRATAPKFNPFTKAWVDPVINASDKNATYVDYDFRTTGATAGTSKPGVQVASAANVSIDGNSGSLMLMPQYGTPNWNTLIFPAAALAAKVKWATEQTQTAASWIAAVTAENANAWKGSRIEVVYNVQDGTDAYIVGAENKFIRVGYPLDLSATADTEVSKSWVPAKQYNYIIGLAGDNVSGGFLLDPYYTDATGTPTPGDLVDTPVDVDPGSPVNPNSNISFSVGVEVWGDGDQGGTDLN